MAVSKRPMREFPRDIKALGKLIRSLTLQVSGDEIALTDADIPASIARDTEVAAAVTAEVAARNTAIAAALATHEAALDPHPGYTTAAELAAALAALGLASGVWTPTLDNTTNVSASTAFQCQYMRVGSVVTFSGVVSITCTAPTSDTVLGVSLPIASNFGAIEDCGGTAAALSAQVSAAIRADAANNRAEIHFFSVDTTARNFYFSGTYRII